MKRSLLFFYHTLLSYTQRKRWKSETKIFCLSLQKSGTTSVGDFFEFFGFPVVRSDMAQLRGWNEAWFTENYSEIFKDPVFRNYQVFEDAPFWAKGFYQILAEKFPDAIFILFSRDKNDWFESLVHHGKGEILGNKRFHAKNYNRPEVGHNKNFKISNHKTYYTQFYEDRNQEIIDYFKGKNTLFFYGVLEDSMKWDKLASFLGLSLPENFKIHSNKSSR